MFIFNKKRKMPQYVRRKEVLAVLKVHYQTLYRMKDKGLIDVKRTDGGHI